MEEIVTPEIRSSTNEELTDELSDEFILNLPRERLANGNPVCLYQGFWCNLKIIKAVFSFQKYFRAHDDDIILATLPKSGTTWLKALAYLIVNRNRCQLKESPLLNSMAPHDLVPFFEFDLYLKEQSLDLEGYPKPRIFSTHVPYASLPLSIQNSNCKIVYVCRNPLDQFISYWHFMRYFPREGSQPLTFEEAFENYCRGAHGYGPFWNHILQYRDTSLENPNKVLFLKYEELKEDIIFQLKRLAEFLGFPFTKEEEKEGVIEEISRLCSFETMKESEVNKSGRHSVMGVPNNSFFRKGEMGDWKNYLTPTMAEKLKKVIQEKLGQSGLTFN